MSVQPTASAPVASYRPQGFEAKRAWALEKVEMLKAREEARAAKAASRAAAIAAAAARSVETPASKAITDTYKPGSVASENVASAISAVKIARTYIEQANFGASIFNSAKSFLENDEKRAQISAVWGEQRLNDLTGVFKKMMADGQRMMSAGSANLNRYFQVSGAIVSKSEYGTYKPGSYTLAAQAKGWNVTVKSSGEAKSVANGIDVTDQVSDNSSTGFKWSDVIAKSNAATLSGEETDQAKGNAATSATPGGLVNVAA